LPKKGYESENISLEHLYIGYWCLLFSIDVEVALDLQELEVGWSKAISKGIQFR